jgi:hypothetical protein
VLLVLKLKIIIFTVQKRKNRRISLIIQEGKLKSIYPNSTISRNRENNLKWIGIIRPTPLSKEYEVNLIYGKDKGVDVYITKPKELMLYNGKKELPHVYSTKKQKLCLYYPKYREWTVEQLYTDSIIPWTSEWLMHYELWLITGIWNGGGKHPPKNKEKDKTEKE